MNVKTKIFLFAAAVTALIIFDITLADAQCAMCKASVESGLKDGKQTVGKGLNDGILYLMAVPYLLLVFLGWFFFRDKIRKFFSMFKNIYNDPVSKV